MAESAMIDLDRALATLRTTGALPVREVEALIAELRAARDLRDAIHLHSLDSSHDVGCYALVDRTELDQATAAYDAMLAGGDGRMS